MDKGGITGESVEDLEILLDEHGIFHPDRESFWPFGLLCRLLTPDRIATALGRATAPSWAPRLARRRDWLVDRIGAAHDTTSNGRKGYLRILAILIFMGRPESIEDFVNFDVSDGYLPLQLIRTPGRQLRVKSGKVEFPLALAFSWSLSDVRQFNMYQWRFNVPFFEFRDGQVAHHSFPPQTILPWLYSEDHGRHVFEGSSATVRRVDIDPHSHDFYQPLKEMLLSPRFFAVKTYSPGWLDWDINREVHFLKRFNGRINPHIITLLTTFEYRDTYNLVFAHAECDLLGYWQRVPSPHASTSAVDVGGLRWLSVQILGLASALDTLHNPGGDLFARHGDIKPGNILWFLSNKDERGIFVLTDFGLSSLNSKLTRSNVPTRGLGWTAAYRPPESDFVGGVTSRSWDIWQLGCVFLEMACWMLGGIDEVEEFDAARISRAVTGIAISTFFDIEMAEGAQRPAVFVVKKQVKERISMLRERTECTNYMHDFLDLIGDRMIQVENFPAQTPQLTVPVKLEVREVNVDGPTTADESIQPTWRIRSGELVQVLRKMDQVAQESDAYVAKAFVPPTPPPAPIPEVVVAEVDEKHVASRLAKGQHTGKTWGSIRRLEDRSIPRPPRTPTDTKPPSPIIAGTRWQLCEEIAEAVEKDCEGTDQTTTHEATFEIHWQLQQCLREDLDSDADLRSSMTISGDSSHSWVVSCREYVAEIWKELGTTLFDSLESILEGASKAATDATSVLSESIPTGSKLIFLLPSADEESRRPAVVNFSGTAFEITTMAQLLAWIAATFRLPSTGKLACSTITFQPSGAKLRYSMRLNELHDLEPRENGTCWTPLFPSTVMAYDFRVPTHEGTRGLQIPVQALLELAEVLYDVTLENDKGKDDGVYFDCISWKLYPTNYIKDGNIVQWHLVEKDPDQTPNHALAPDHESPRHLWARNIGIETLTTATAVLGYCSDVAIQLGTASRVPQYEKYRASRADIHRPLPEMSVNAMSVAANLVGRATVGLTVLFRPRKGAVDAQKAVEKMSYTTILARAAVTPVILFETEPRNERAWVVPQLSLVLDLYNFWAFCQTDAAVREQVRYAEAGPDGGEKAKAVLSDYKFASKTAIKAGYKGEPKVRVGQMIKRIYGCILGRIAKDAESQDGARWTKAMGTTPITGWDWMDLIPEFSWPVARSRDVRPKISWLRHQTPSWMPLTRDIPVFFGQHMGEVIEPVHPGRVCKHWYPLPGGFEENYLAASVRCLEMLAKKYGKDAAWIFFDRLVWEFKDATIFNSCVDCIDDPSKCLKDPQLLGDQREVLHKPRPAADLPVPAGEKKGPRWSRRREQDPLHQQPPEGAEANVGEVEGAEVPAAEAVVPEGISMNGAVVFGRSRKKVEQLRQQPLEMAHNGRAAIVEAAIVQDNVAVIEGGEGIVAEAVAAEVALPEEAVPEAAVPEEAVPEEAVPEAAVPEEAVPEEAVLEAVLQEANVVEAAGVNMERNVIEAIVAEAVVREVNAAREHGTDLPRDWWYIAIILILVAIALRRPS